VVSAPGAIPRNIRGLILTQIKNGLGITGWTNKSDSFQFSLIENEKVFHQCHHASGVITRQSFQISN
jgi:hypothetical protein